MDWQRDGFTVSTDPARLDMAFTVDALAETYWCKGTPKAKIEKSIGNALIFGLYEDETARQVGFCRVVTDFSRFAWLSDVFVLDEMRGRALGKFLVGCTVDHPELVDVTRFLLATNDAHGLYRQYGFENLAEAEKFMLKSAAP
ncbi:MAG: GNAT family N-acetyltransferase [Rhodospirillaceae bacterium]|nr:GNAT family N-acetyltransferase [Rhodospirillaceae bacterium]MBT4042676.1 GNAT family N-acetyltransferase [Rhodospirillaceae bacterium]MBT4687765.1 GNAT family N-acetyltransferase [Rhodospirillaceae bacterium]MBT5082811.1 GNAT family N-acetyltransferase [Rhodospirillaceae bacterium]MBT5524255.1 GNAT family N-acetyltransferase [Rhodospirillaceae bacterium]